MLSTQYLVQSKREVMVVAVVSITGLVGVIHAQLLQQRPLTSQWLTTAKAHLLLMQHLTWVGQPSAIR